MASKAMQRVIDAARSAIIPLKPLDAPYLDNFRTELHHNAYQNSDGTCARYRVNGQMQTWTTRPGEFRLPVKRGMREYGNVTHDTLHNFHDGKHCPVDAAIAAAWRPEAE